MAGIAQKPIPDDVLVAAITATLTNEQYGGKCTDKWGEEEASFCRKCCGEQYLTVETDWIRQRATNLRKAGRLPSVNGGPKRKKYAAPEGDYLKYLRSDHWRTFRLGVLEFWDWKCCLCKSKAVDVHHNTYARIGHELLSDCVALCQKCHRRVHSNMPHGNDEMNSGGFELF